MSCRNKNVGTTYRFSTFSSFTLQYKRWYDDHILFKLWSILRALDANVRLILDQSDDIIMLSILHALFEFRSYSFCTLSNFTSKIIWRLSWRIFSIQGLGLERSSQVLLGGFRANFSGALFFIRPHWIRPTHKITRLNFAQKRKINLSLTFQKLSRKCYFKPRLTIKV